MTDDTTGIAESGDAWVVIGKSAVSERVKDQLLHAIQTGRYKPGDRLPSERELAATLQVGRTSVREAIQSLKADSRVEVRHGQGVFVAEAYVSKTLRQRFLQDGHNLEELYELREVLEIEAARLAAKRRTPDDLKALAAVLDEIDEVRETSGELAVLRQLAIEFHRIMSHASQNTLFERTGGVISELSRDSVPYDGLTPERLQRSADEHRLILKAIEDGDGDLAAQLARDHVQNSRTSLYGKLDGRTLEDLHEAGPSGGAA